MKKVVNNHFFDYILGFYILQIMIIRDIFFFFGTNNHY